MKTRLNGGAVCRKNLKMYGKKYGFVIILNNELLFN